MLEIIPFGSVVEERFNTSKQHNLVEMCAGIWRMSSRARENYDPISFIKFLQGKVDKPDRIKKQEQPQTGFKQDKEQIIDSLLML
jgi:hypothetical protein